MGIYNIKVYEYAESTQVRLYNIPQLFDEKVKFPKPDLYFKEKQVMKENEQFKTVHTSELSDSETERTQEQIENCIRSSHNRTISQIYEISRMNIWDYFLTLTFDRNKVDSSNYDLLCNKVSKWLNNIRSRYAPDLKYLIVPELHKDGEHYHFHGLLADIGKLTLFDSGIKKGGHTIYNLKHWNYGFSTVSRVESSAKVSSYITKYITKDLCVVGKNKHRYWCSKNCDRVKPKIYNLPLEDIEKFVDDHTQYMQHVSTSIAPHSGLHVTYIELKKEDLT